MIRALMEKFPELRHSISYTTRPVRKDRADLEDYHFVDEETFRNMVEQNEFLEWAKVHNHYYGTCRRDLLKLLESGFDAVLDIDIQGALTLRKMYPKGVQIFILPPSLSVLEERLRSRGSETEENLKTRLRNAKKEIQAYGNYDYVIINDDLAKAIENIRCILIAEHCKTSNLNCILEYKDS